MAKQVITLHLYEYTEGGLSGERVVHSFDLRQHGAAGLSGRIWLGQQEVEIDWPEADTRQLQIDELERQVIAERGQSEHRINLLLDRISKLQAIGHEVAE